MSSRSNQSNRIFSDIITFWQVCNSEFICLFGKLMCYDLWYLFEFDLPSNWHVFTNAKLSQYNRARFAPFCTSHQKEFSKCCNSNKEAIKMFESSLIQIESSLIELNGKFHWNQNIYRTLYLNREWLSWQFDSSLIQI